MEQAVFAIQVLLSAVFVFVGFGKISGSSMFRMAFIKWRLPPWSLQVTGFAEITGGIMLLFGLLVQVLALYGLLLLFFICIGAMMTHVRMKDGVKEMLPIIVLFVLIVFLLLYFL
ncbi:MAG: DoxX family protein [Lysinibacillus sp.]